MEIPQSWRDALLRLHANGFPEAIIGGGALRDLDHGVEIKDVDFFVMEKPTTKDALDAAFGRKGRTLVSSAASRYLGFEDDVYMVVDYANEGAPPFQVIAQRNVVPDYSFLEYQIERFDLGLCRIVYDGISVIAHSTYHADKAAKVLRIRDPRRIPRSITRAERIGAKYPGYSIVVPDEAGDVFTP